MRRALIALAVLALVGYGLFEARRLLEGPSITIISPIDGTALEGPLVQLAGTAHNIAFLTINDRPAFTDEAGNFAELLSPPPGYTVFTVAATDRFGRSVSKQVSITLLNFCPVETYA